MKKIATILLIVLLILGPGPIAAQSQVVDPGALPGSFLYIFDRLFENIGGLFTFGEENRAERQLRLAEERLAEARALHELNRSERIDRAANDFNQAIGRANQIAQESQEQSLINDVADFTREARNAFEDVVGQSALSSDVEMDQGVLTQIEPIAIPSAAQIEYENEHVIIYTDGDYRYISTTSIPDHETGDFPNPGNPNTISAQNLIYRIPVNPDYVGGQTSAQLPGVGLTGVVMEPGTAEREAGWNIEAIQDQYNLGLDENNAHVQPTGLYHYHGVPTGLVENLSGEDDVIHIGWAADGFPMYISHSGAYVSSYNLKSGARDNAEIGGVYDGTYTQDFEFVDGSGDLDECNGVFIGEQYAYFLTEEFPYISRCLNGEIDPSFTKGPGSAGMGAPGQSGSVPTQGRGQLPGGYGESSGIPSQPSSEGGAPSGPPSGFIPPHNGVPGDVVNTGFRPQSGLGQDGRLPPRGGSGQGLPPEDPLGLGPAGGGTAGAPSSSIPSPGSLSINETGGIPDGYGLVVDDEGTSPIGNYAHYLDGLGDATITWDDTYRYISSNGLPNYTITGGRFAHEESAQSFNFTVPLNPQLNDRVQYYNIPFTFGIAVNGVVMEPFADEWYNDDRSSGWQEDPFRTLRGFDISNAHVQPDGTYHYHGLPTQIMADYVSGTHSPVVGYAGDGFPIYYQYVYADPTDASSSIIEVDSSYRLKTGTRSGGPGGAHDGTYNQDYEYIESISDLDECNGRWGITPEYPNGTYYYVITESFPYIGRCHAADQHPSFAGTRG